MIEDLMNMVRSHVGSGGRYHSREVETDGFVEAERHFIPDRSASERPHMAPDDPTGGTNLPP